MAMTAMIETSDGVTHPNAFALVYPLTLQTLTGDAQLRMTVHCWHSVDSRSAGKAELDGFPTEIQLDGDAALAAIVGGLGSMSAISWGSDPVANALVAESAIIAALENTVVGLMPQFSRIVE